jgi:hypothetical protein
MSPFIGLNAGLVIRAHDMSIMLMAWLDRLLQLANRLDVFITLLRILGAFMMQPIPRLLWFSSGFF